MRVSVMTVGGIEFREKQGIWQVCQPSLMDAVEAKVEENREEEVPLDIY
jgi:hypothetical protein